MRTPTVLLIPFGFVATFAAAAAIIEGAHTLYRPFNKSAAGFLADAQGCHGMVLRDLGLFQNHVIALADGQHLIVNQWLCPDPFKFKAFENLSAQAYPSLHPELWDAAGKPVPVSVSRSLYDFSHQTAPQFK